MYLLNNRKEEYTEGLTVSKIIEIKKYSYKKKIVRVNDKLIEEVDWDKTLIHEGDDVKIIHLLAGG